MEKERILFLDAIKGFAIFLMVLAHAIAWNFENWQNVVLLQDNIPLNTIHAGFIWQFIYSFHMPLFFLVSGYLLYKPDVSLGGALLGMRKKTMRLLVPYFATGFLITLIRPGFGYWFLFSLWELSIIGILMHVVLNTVNKKNIIVVDFLIIGLVWFLLEHTLTHSALSNPVADVGCGVQYFLPFMAGFLIRKYKQMDDFLSRYYTIIVITFLLIFSLRYLQWEQPIFNKAFNIVNKCRLTGIIGSLTFYYLFKEGVSKQFESFLSWMGKYTFEIYIFHVFFVLRISQVGSFWINTNLPTCLATQILYCSVVSLFAIGISIVIASFVKHSPLLSKLMFGQ